MSFTSLSRRPATCLLCQWHRTFTTAGFLRQAGNVPPSTSRPAPAAPKPDVPFIDAPRTYGERVDKFTPKPLPRPIGFPDPPSAGENTGIDPRSLRQRRDDFVDYDKHLIRREELKEQFRRPYFQDWSNMQFHEGKSFIAPPRLFKAEKALYFPNFYGQTLEKVGAMRDTTPLLAGKASVVAVFSSQWAENQVDTFISREANPALHEVLDGHRGAAQLVRINVEDNALKAWIVRMVMGGLRRRIGEPDWDKYFLVRKGITDVMREHIGLFNSKVGYVYLVDPQWRIRWAGSGPSEEEERASLARGLRKVVDEVSTSPLRGIKA